MHIIIHRCMFTAKRHNMLYASKSRHNASQHASTSKRVKRCIHAQHAENRVTTRVWRIVRCHASCVMRRSSCVVRRASFVARVVATQTQHVSMSHVRANLYRIFKFASKNVDARRTHRISCSHNEIRNATHAKTCCETWSIRDTRNIRNFDIMRRNNACMLCV